MKRLFAIGDIHGCVLTFKRMLFEELKIQQQDEIYCLGDYIDRGIDSKGVIDVILYLKKQGYQIHTLRGNHEQMMMDSTENEDNFYLWNRNGGDITLKSFGINSYSDMPLFYKEFFEQTKFYIETSKYIFVHASLNFHKENIFEDKNAMLWTRDFPSHHQLPGNKILIHGHTPEPLKYILKQKGNYINLDGGCVYKSYRQFGNLVALNLTDTKFSVVKCLD